MIASLLKWGVPLVAALPLLATESQREEIQNAGVCSRCHVTSSLEWGISVHSSSSKKGKKVNCVGCHGESKAHVADEQNSVKPDRRPRGDEAITALCIECHESGCPKTEKKTSCTECHHHHALVNPKLDPEAADKRAKQLTAQLEAASRLLAEGQKQVQLQKWEAARDSFRAALKENPGSGQAKSALLMSERRLKPGLRGFKIVGDQFDSQTGLPKEIAMDGLGINFGLMPAGEFDLGSDRLAAAKPVHSVRVEPFYLAKFELTQAQWRSLMGTNISFHQGEKYPEADRMPVEQVSWEDCQAMLHEINKRVPGGGFRLPTEAEWEYAARAGASEPMPPDQVLRYAWLDPNTQPANPVPATRTGYYLQGSGVISSPRPVGTREPNRWGLYDMLGNVSEWCSTLFEPYPYSATDGRESAASPGARVVRGGNFSDMIESADFALRHPERPYRRLRWNGVRLAFSPPEEGQTAMGSKPNQP